MSESLRDLVVSLSLNTDNFTRHVKSVIRFPPSRCLIHQIYLT